MTTNGIQGTRSFGLHSLCATCTDYQQYQVPCKFMLKGYKKLVHKEPDVQVTYNIVRQPEPTPSPQDPVYTAKFTYLDLDR